MSLKAAHTMQHNILFHHIPLSLSTPRLAEMGVQLASVLGTRLYDVILIDPPADWSWEAVASLRIEDIAAVPSFAFLWAGDGEGIERGRDVLAKWGYRRAEGNT